MYTYSRGERKVTSECAIETTLNEGEPVRTRRLIPPCPVALPRPGRPGEASAATPVVDRSAPVVAKYDVLVTAAKKCDAWVR